MFNVTLQNASTNTLTYLPIILPTSTHIKNVHRYFTEREYQCLGQWQEDGLIYTYTERRDMIGYECFVGLITAKGDIHLREAGHNCERGQDPLREGMRLTQVSKCYGSFHPRMHWQSSTATTGGRTTATTSSSRNKKITALPRWRERELNNEIDSGAIHTRGSLSHIFLSVFCFVVVTTFLNGTH